MFLNKNITVKKLDNHWTQEDTREMVYLEHCILWFRDRDTKKLERNRVMKCDAGEKCIRCSVKVINEKALGSREEEAS